MAKLTLEQIKSKTTNGNNSFSLNCCDTLIEIKTKLTPIEEQIFIDTIANESFLNNEYSSIRRQCITECLFIKMFVVNDEDHGIDLPDKNDDLFEIYDIIKPMNLIAKAIDVNNILGTYIHNLNHEIDKNIEFKKQKIVALYAQSSANSEAIEAFKNCLEKATDLVETTNKFVEKNGTKLSKHLTAKRLDSWFEQIKTLFTNTILDKIDEDKSSENVIPFNKK